MYGFNYMAYTISGLADVFCTFKISKIIRDSQYVSVKGEKGNNVWTMKFESDIFFTSKKCIFLK